jgi:hypothetical protein
MSALWPDGNSMDSSPEQLGGFLCDMFLQESEIHGHLKDARHSGSEASGPKSFLGLVSCSEAQQGAV